MPRWLPLAVLLALSAPSASSGQVYYYPCSAPAYYTPYVYWPRPVVRTVPVAVATPAPPPKTLAKDGKPAPPLLPPPTPDATPATGKVALPPPPAAEAPPHVIYPVAARTAPTADRKQATIGFYNHTGKEVTVTANGKTVVLPKRGHVELELPLTFTWETAGGKAQTSKVPADAAGLEIVFRQQ